MTMYGTGSWCVWLDGEFLSSHDTRDGAVAAARNVQRAEAQGDGPPRTVSVGRVYQGEGR